MYNILELLTVLITWRGAQQMKNSNIMTNSILITCNKVEQHISFIYYNKETETGTRGK
jgi:hypothetical protein